MKLTWEEQKLTWEEQQAAFEKYKDSALNMMSMFAESYREIVLAEAEKRFREGYATFGSNMFNTEDDKLWQEAIEEAADFVDYMVAVMWRRDNR